MTQQSLYIKSDCILWPSIHCTQIVASITWPITHCTQTVACILWHSPHCTQTVTCILWLSTHCTQTLACILWPISRCVKAVTCIMWPRSHCTKTVPCIYDSFGLQVFSHLAGQQRSWYLFAIILQMSLKIVMNICKFIGHPANGFLSTPSVSQCQVNVTCSLQAALTDVTSS
jgi:hypothetical protein